MTESCKNAKLLSYARRDAKEAHHDNVQTSKPLEISASAALSSIERVLRKHFPKALASPHLS